MINSAKTLGDLVEFAEMIRAIVNGGDELSQVMQNLADEAKRNSDSLKEVIAAQHALGKEKTALENERINLADMMAKQSLLSKEADNKIEELKAIEIDVNSKREQLALAQSAFNKMSGERETDLNKREAELSETAHIISERENAVTKREKELNEKINKLSEAMR